MNVFEELKELYGASGVLEPLQGGQGTSVRTGELVFKPVSNTQVHESITELFAALSPRGYKINTHVKSKNGRYCELGYCATVFEDGEASFGRLEEKLYIIYVLAGLAVVSAVTFLIKKVRQN